MTDKTAAYLVPLCIIIVLAPLLYFQTPLHITEADMQYVKGKVLRVMEGEIFSDPVTGLPNFHPPYYHMFLAAFAMTGIPLDTLIYIVSIIIVSLIFIFAYGLYRKRFSREVALLTIPLIPMWFEFIGGATMYLASAAYFSLPVYLAGLWVFVSRQDVRGTIMASVLWGSAFLISPWYAFILLFTLLYILLVRRNTRTFLASLATLMIVFIPFYIQTYIVFKADMYGTAAFNLWPGFPGPDFFASLVENFLAPVQHTVSTPLVWAAALITGLGLAGLVRHDSYRWVVGVTALAFLFTFFHYQPNYANRIHLLFGLIISPFAVRFLLESKLRKGISIGIVLIIAALGFFQHYDHVLNRYAVQEIGLRWYYDHKVPEMAAALREVVEPDQFVLATSETYRYDIMPNVPVRALLAWRSAEYYQVKSSVSERLDRDYKIALQCDDPVCLNYICDRYGIHAAVYMIHTERGTFPVFPFIESSWEKVYESEYFRIFIRPDNNRPRQKNRGPISRSIPGRISIPNS